MNHPEEEVFVEPAIANHSPEASQTGEVTDAVFGEVGADGPNYRSVSELTRRAVTMG
jgi:hypothetical protein